MNAVNGGDIRSINFNRLIEVSEFFIDDNLVTDEAFRELRDNLEWAPKLIRGSSVNREQLAIKLEQTYRNMIISTRNKKMQVTA